MIMALITEYELGWLLGLLAAVLVIYLFIEIRNILRLQDDDDDVSMEDDE